MRDYTIMNLIHTTTGYYYKSAERLEIYIGMKITFKQLHFKTVEEHHLYEEELNFLKSESDTTKEKYQRYLDTIGKVYLNFLFFVLTAVSYLIISSLLKDGGLIVSSLSILIIPMLLAIWTPAWLHTSKGKKLSSKINSIEGFIQNYLKQTRESKSIQTDNIISEEIQNLNLDTCFYILSILEERNIIQPKNKESVLYKIYLEEQAKITNYNSLERVRNKKVLINSLTTFVTNGQAEGRKNQKDRNTIAFFSLNANVLNDGLNKLLCDILVWESKSGKSTYKTEISSGFNRSLSSIYTDLDIINQSYPHPFIDEILISKEQKNN